MATAALTGTDKQTQARALRSTLEEAAAAINAHHAHVLSAVIAMKEQNLHRSEFGFSALFSLLKSQFDFHNQTAADIAVIAKLSRKFGVLTQAAATGSARIDQVAYAVRWLDKTPAMRLFAKTPFRTPVPSPFDAETLCATPEALIAQYCAHAPFKDLQRHLKELAAQLADESELLRLSRRAVPAVDRDRRDRQRHVVPLRRTLRRDRASARQVLEDRLPAPEAGRPRLGRCAPGSPQPACRSPPPAARGLRRLLLRRRPGTATRPPWISWSILRRCRVRTPGDCLFWKGQPISLARARLLACEGVVIPSVFNYATGEAVELGRAVRLPNTALRRKLELEQPEGCAWNGCDLPIAWTEAHHIIHWADGGVTNAANLVLLCRFHHGRIHTTGWTVEKTGPGQAVITHHEDHETQGDSRGTEGTGCGCADWRTDADMDAEHRADDFDYFPTGLYRSEWSENMKPDLDARAEAAEQARSLAAMRAARAQCRERFATPATVEATPGEPSEKAPERVRPKQPAHVGHSDLGDPPFLRCPLRGSHRGGEGKAHTGPIRATPPSSNPPRVRALPHARQPKPTRTGQPPSSPVANGTSSSLPARTATISVPGGRIAHPAPRLPLRRCRPNPNHFHTRQPKDPPTPCSPRCRCPLD